MADYTSLLSSLGVPAAQRKNVSLVVDALRNEGILTPKVLAYTLATIGHESDFGRNMMEIGAAQQAARYGYQGGAKYAGRGFVQLTGRDNYKMYGDMLGIDLVNNPEKAADPEIAAKITALYMKHSGTARAAERGDFVGARKGVNPGEFNLSRSHPQTKNPAKIANQAGAFLKKIGTITPQDWAKSILGERKIAPRQPMKLPKPETKETAPSAQLKTPVATQATIKQLARAMPAPQTTQMPQPMPRPQPQPQPTPMQNQQLMQQQQPLATMQQQRLFAAPPPTAMPRMTAAISSAMASPAAVNTMAMRPTYTAAAAPAPAARYVTVQPGQTLWGIAQQQLGSGSRWRELGYQGDPRRLQVGTRIPVPSIAA